MAALLQLLLAGCSHETQLDSPTTTSYCKVRLDIDWATSGIELDGMTAIFYPTDGSQCSQFLSNQVTGKEISLKPGIYNVVVFNQAAGDFSYFTIEGQDQYATLRVVMKERACDWYKPEAGERVAHEPEPFAVALTQGFEVTEAMLQASRVEGKIFSFACQPKIVTYPTKIAIHFKGLHNIKEGRGSIQNMADTYWITEQKTGTRGITHCFTMADKTYDKGSTSDGILSGSFYSFGPAEVVTKATTANLLKLSFLLVDNKTVIKKTYDATVQIVAAKPKPNETPKPENKQPAIEIGSGNPSSPSKPTDSDNPNDKEDLPIKLPDVKPEDSGSEGGFDASVDDWGDETEIEIPV